MYSMETINENKNTIENLLRQVTRKDARIEELIKKLESTDFFTAPASTKYHNAEKGGLADHSLNVYYNLKSLVERKALQDSISEDSIIICALLHDMSKMNYYEPSIRNKKVYSEHGSKHDNLGNFDWVSEESYAVIPETDRFMYASHEQNSEFMVRQYIPLTLSESIAILHHHGGMGFDSSKMNITAIYGAEPLATLLHVADMISTYVDEE